MARRRRGSSDGKILGFLVVAAVVLTVVLAVLEAVRAYPGVFATLVVLGGGAWWYVWRRRRQTRERHAAEAQAAIEEEKRWWRETPVEPGRFTVLLTSVRDADVHRMLGFLSRWAQQSCRRVGSR